MDRARHERSWQVLLPVRAEAGKSRLGVEFGEDPTEYFARDTLAAVRACTQVGSVTIVGRKMPEADRVVADPGGGLNAAITAGLNALDPHRPVVVMLADLPGLRTADLHSILEQAAPADRAIVIDHAGTGTTMALASTPQFTPLFGLDSAARFAAAGFTVLDAERSARLDVDTAENLQQVLRLGVGPATAAWWKRNGAASYVYCRLK